MKRSGLLLILFIAIIGNSRGQTYISGTSIYKLSVEGNVTQNGSSCGEDITPGLQWVVAEKQSGRQTLVRGSSDYPNNGHGLRHQDFYGEHYFSKSNKVTKLIYRTVYRDHNWLTGCKDVQEATQHRSVNICHYADYNFSGLNQPGHAVERVYPIVELATPTGINSNISDHDLLTIELTDNIDNQYYNWEYAIESGSFQPIPSVYNNKVILKIKGEDFLPNDAFGKTIWIRVNMGYCGGDNRESNHIPFKYLPSAPHINQTIYTPPVCHGENNGKIHIEFDRPLYDKERLYFALKDNNTHTYDITDTLAIDPVSLTATVNGMPAGFYDYRVYGSYRIGTSANDTINTYTDGIHHTDTITIPERPKVVYTVSQDSVHCHAGTDGAIHVNAIGGVGQYYAALFAANGSDTLQTKFFSGTTRFENLKKGDYKIYLKDLHNCEPQWPDSTYQRLSVKEPDKALQTYNTGYQEPKAFGYSDGIIWSYISGGTGAYDVTWRDSTGTIVKNETLVRPTAGSSIRTEATGIKKGTYYLYVKDQNHDSATPPTLENYCGCEALDSIFVDEPPKLLVSVDTLHYVTCYGDTDGRLVAHATGGRPDHTTAMPYTYQWHKITADSTTVLESYTVINDSILTGLPSAHYVICITDTNHIKAYSPVFHLTEPDLLKVKVQVNRNLSCSGETSGEMEVIVTGGTKPYSYFWETGDTTRVVSGLGKGIYSVFVRDGRYADHRKDQGWYTHYCQEEATGEITSPNGMNISSVLTHPTCNSYSDGKIELAVTGGVAPYSYLWNDGVTTSNRDNLPDGQYSITVIDANGCSLSENYQLEEPEPLIVNIGNDFTLCKDQIIKVNGGVGLSDISYLWTDGNNNALSSDSVYSIGKAGQYRLQVTNQAGCTAGARIRVSQSDTELTTDFVVASKIPNNTKVNAVNIIRTGYDNVEWILPDEAIVWDETRDKLQFSIPQNGYYTIGMIAQKEDCQDVLYKTLEVVNKGDIDWTEEDSEPFLKNFIVYPNPNDGNFRAKVELREVADYSLFLYDTNGNLIESKTIRNSRGEESYFNRTTAPAGAYYLRFVSQKTTSALKIMINK